MSKKIMAIDVVVVTEKKRSLNVLTVLAALAIIALFVLSGVLAVYVEQNINSQNQSKQIASLKSQIDQLEQLIAPKLVSVGFQYTDNRSDSNSPFLHVSGYVVNVGSAEANNCTIYVTGIESGNITVLNSSALIPSLGAGASEAIDFQFPYYGQALVAYTSYLSWTN